MSMRAPSKIETSLEIVRTLAELRSLRDLWRRDGERVALVPTMGALHEGHMSLVDLARQHADRVIVSIFVNPAQFAPTEDFSKYPRTFDTDTEKVASAGADAIFAPVPDTIYPEGFSTQIMVSGPAKAGLEDRFRPEHFNGVATVVAKLHIMASPDIAVYGEKDFQQLAVIRQMNRDLNLPVDIMGAPIIRANDGLALSSRNIYLKPEERANAPALYHTLCRCRDQLLSGSPTGTALKQGLEQLAAATFKPDYLELRVADTLEQYQEKSGRPARLLAAAYLGTTRLIDNIDVPAV